MLFARTGDPVLGFLKAGGLQTDEQIVELVLATCFEGLASR
jgi:TetR/AcrR family transcriptional regulator, regulator of autoinduction and epiphytic fitness